MKFLRRKWRATELVALAVAGAAAAAIFVIAGWRMALVALVAAGAIVTTRVRFCGCLAALLLVLAALALAGHGSDRPDLRHKANPHPRAHRHHVSKRQTS